MLGEEQESVPERILGKEGAAEEPEETPLAKAQLHEGSPCVCRKTGGIVFLGGRGDRFTVFYVRTERLDYVLWSKNYPLSLNVRGPWRSLPLV